MDPFEYEHLQRMADQVKREFENSPYEADEAAYDLLSVIREFEQQTGPLERVEIEFPGGTSMLVEDIARCGRHLLRIQGRDVAGRGCVLVQNVTQVAVMLRARPLEEGEQKRPIGFR